MPAHKTSKTPTEPDLHGRMAGEYRIVRKIGSGGFGAVYEAEHPVLQRKAAVKVLHPTRAVDSSAVTRFFAEARAANQIKHRNIVDIFSFGTLDNGQHFYVMDLLEGAPLDRYLEQRERLPVEVLLALLRPVANALDALHARGIVHRDVKPANIYLAWDSSDEVVPKLLDFGLVKLIGGDSPAQTASGVPMGTPYYMSPEQCRGEKIDARADVYAFGVVCHELFTGRPPLTGDSPASVLVAHVIQTPPPMSSVERDLPVELDAPVLQMLAKRAEERPESVGAAFELLERAAREAGISVLEAPLRLPKPVLSSSSETNLSRQDTEPGSLVERSDLPVSRTTEGAAHREGQARSLELGAKSPSGARVPAWAPTLAGVGLLLVASYLLKDAWSAAQAPKPEASLPASVASPAASAPVPVPTPVPLPPEPPTNVPLTLVGAPPGATVRFGEETLGQASSPVSLPYGRDSIELTVMAPGFESQTLTVVPDSPIERRVSMTRSVPNVPKKRELVPRDLENPF
jgi:serine/threonine-protein kinase